MPTNQDIFAGLSVVRGVGDWGLITNFGQVSAYEQT